MFRDQRGISSIGLIITVCLLFSLWWIYNYFTTIQQVSDMLKRLDIAASANSNDEVLMLSGALVQFSSDLVSDRVRANVYNQRGCAFLNKGLYKEALSCFESATRYNTAFASPYYNIGLIYERFSDAKNAVTAYKKYLQLVSKDKDDEFTEHAKRYIQ